MSVSILSQRQFLTPVILSSRHCGPQTLIAKEVDSWNNFDWQQQLRFYWVTENNEDDCFVRQSNAYIRYAYEYMGVATRLVITPLTDRCWMTITGALHLKLGAAPAGPAGTGKTEVRRENTHGKQCYERLSEELLEKTCTELQYYLMIF